MDRCQCPHCQGGIRADDQYAGQVVHCPTCKKPVQMPAVVQRSPSKDLSPWEKFFWTSAFAFVGLVGVWAVIGCAASQQDKMKLELSLVIGLFVGGPCWLILWHFIARTPFVMVMRGSVHVVRNGLLANLLTNTRSRLARAWQKLQHLVESDIRMAPPQVGLMVKS